MLHRILPPLALCAGLATQGAAEDPKPKVIELPSAHVDCLIENADKYLGIKRAVVIFTPGYCPAISRREVIEAANAAQNSADPDANAVALTRLALSKPRLRCMFDQLRALQSESEDSETKSEDEAAPKTISLTLDCP